MTTTLREIRFRKRISQWELSRISGVHQSRISLIENGHSPKSDERERLVKQLKINISDIEWPGR
jgi:transcriptional regulator with XRE-family HTH domain